MTSLERAHAVDVVVVGSANVDVVLRVGALPAAGETVLARDRTLGAGGKGANQAVAAARAGARVTLISALGDDPPSAILMSALTGAGVDVSVIRRSDVRTGSAYVVVDDVGENQIVVDPGANAMLDGLLPAERDLLRSTRVVLAQLEVPLPTVTAAVREARDAGALTVVNAAPATDLPNALTDALDVLVVNDAEARAVAGRKTVDEAVEALRQRVPTVLVTRGAEGVVVATATGSVDLVPAVPARRVVDTTGAGDTFCGAFAAAAARGLPVLGAARWACAAASLSVERHGAAASAPTAVEVEERLCG